MFNPMKLVTAPADLAAGALAGSAKNKANKKYLRALEAVERELYSPLNVPVAMIPQESDSQAHNAQRAAIQHYLATMNEADGLTPQDELALQEIEDRQRATEQSQREAIMADARARGMGLSGSTLAAQLGANQDAAMNARRGGLATAAMGQQRRTDAAGNAFRAGINRQVALDNINRFNANQKNVRFLNQRALAGDKADLRLNRAGVARDNAHNRINQNVGLYQNFMSNFGGGRVGGGAGGDSTGAPAGGGMGGFDLDSILGFLG